VVEGLAGVVRQEERNDLLEGIRVRKSEIKIIYYNLKMISCLCVKKK